MSATRLLVLGVVRRCGRAHGYRVRSELVSWGAEQWANIKWGSLYHALRQLTKDGLLTATEVMDGQCRTDYELTARGEAEFLRLLRDGLRRPEYRPDVLGAALALLPALPTAEAVGLLTERLAALEAEQLPHPDSQPEHLRELAALHSHAMASAIDWTRGLIARLKATSP